MPKRETVILHRALRRSLRPQPSDLQSQFHLALDFRKSLLSRITHVPTDSLSDDRLRPHSTFSVDQTSTLVRDAVRQLSRACRCRSVASATPTIAAGIGWRQRRRHSRTSAGAPSSRRPIPQHDPGPELEDQCRLLRDVLGENGGDKIAVAHHVECGNGHRRSSEGSQQHPATIDFAPPGERTTESALYIFLDVNCHSACGNTGGRSSALIYSGPRQDRNPLRKRHSKTAHRSGFSAFPSIPRTRADGEPRRQGKAGAFDRLTNSTIVRYVHTLSTRGKWPAVGRGSITAN
jgi:hypothetical protein